MMNTCRYRVLLAMAAIAVILAGCGSKCTGSPYGELPTACDYSEYEEE